MKLKGSTGTEYLVTKTKLRTVNGDVKFWVYLHDLAPENVKDGVQLWLGHDGPGYLCKVYVGANHIGCRCFSPKVFAQIMKAAKKAAKEKRDKTR